MGHDGGMGGGMMGMMGGWMLLWALVGLALLVVAVLAAVWLFKHRDLGRLAAASDALGRRDEAPSAQELLRRRYAAGEIDHEEFQRVQRDLSGS